ncbi:hypothetical protein JRO89_XS01G0319800 [Xanthoceras sorbifolium]|uniref:Protein FAR1-RELATED SEQUENCE n=1 Tax=Xanthoceras sorbifolium TaxID=99658 RepID=A0ABQ8IMP7_9ROSI|nr:hypothetical protein JRO89_XS01G0319800 [Xanthoceras sorbifolium]
MNRDDDNLGTHDEVMDTRLQTPNELDLNVEQDSSSPKVAQINVTPSGIFSKEDDNTVGILKIGAEFESDEHAYRFYNRYARLLGFSVRKDWVNRSKIHGQVVSRKFTCSREGYRRKDKRDINVKKHRKETRTGCLAHMIITRQPDGKYRVTHFEAFHNHDNINPSYAQLLKLQKELCIAQAVDADSPINLGTQSNSESELMNGRFEVRDTLDYLAMDHDNHLRSERHFERVVDEQRYKEAKANDEMGRCMPRLMANVILLKHASEVYTMKAFEVFQREYEKCLNVVVNQCGQNGLLSEYKVKTFGQSREYRVTFNSADDTVVCDCRKFEYVGFLCSHALKVLDHRNIKVVPSRYILKRWTKVARIGSVRESSDFIQHENSKLVAARRYKDLCRSILNISARAADSEEAFQFASRQLEEVIERVERILTLKTEEAQGITSSSTGANASDSENGEILLHGNAIEDQDEESRAQGTRERESSVRDRHNLQSANGRVSKSKRVENVQVHSPNTITCISSPPPTYVSPQDPPTNPVMQSLYSFEADQVVHCMYQQPNLLIDQQPSTDMYQQPNFYSDQHDSPSQTQLLQEPLIRSTYHESVPNTTQLRQAMDLDLQHPHSSSFLLYDHRYRPSESPYLVPK